MDDRQLSNRQCRVYHRAMDPGIEILGGKIIRAKEEQEDEEEETEKKKEN